MGNIDYDLIMSYAILRTQKVKTKNDYMAGLRHHYRIGGLENADPARRHLNFELCTFDEAGKNFDKFFDKKAGKFAKRRKDAVLAIDYLLTASPEFFETAAPEQQEMFFMACRNWLYERHGKENVLMLTIERDESTPHLSAFVVPVDDKGKLNCRHFQGGREKMRTMQDDFHAYITKCGFDLKRGNKVEHTRAKHGLVKDFYRDLRKLIADERFDEMTPEQLKVFVRRLYDANENLKLNLGVANWELDELKQWFFDCAVNGVDLREFVDYSLDVPDTAMAELGKKLQQHFGFLPKPLKAGTLKKVKKRDSVYFLP